MPGLLAAVGIATSIVGAVQGNSAAKDAARAQKKYNKNQRMINQLKNRQAKRAFLRNFRQQQADALTASIAAGVGVDSSLVGGRQSTLGRQGAQAVREFEQMDSLGAAMTRNMNQQASATRRAGQWNAITGFASQFIAFGGK